MKILGTFFSGEVYSACQWAHRNPLKKPPVFCRYKAKRSVQAPVRSPLKRPLNGQARRPLSQPGQERSKAREKSGSGAMVFPPVVPSVWWTRHFGSLLPSGRDIAYQLKGCTVPLEGRKWPMFQLICSSLRPSMNRTTPGVLYGSRVLRCFRGKRPAPKALALALSFRYLDHLGSRSLSPGTPPTPLGRLGCISADRLQDRGFTCCVGGPSGARTPFESALLGHAAGVP